MEWYVELLIQHIMRGVCEEVQLIEGSRPAETGDRRGVKGEG